MKTLACHWSSGNFFLSSNLLTFIYTAACALVALFESNLHHVHPYVLRGCDHWIRIGKKGFLYRSSLFSKHQLIPSTCWRSKDLRDWLIKIWDKNVWKLEESFKSSDFQQVFQVPKLSSCEVRSWLKRIDSLVLSSCSSLFLTSLF